MSSKNELSRTANEVYWLNLLRNFSSAASNGFNDHREDAGFESISEEFPQQLAERINTLFSGKDQIAGKFLFFESVLKIVYWKYSNNPDIITATGFSDKMIFLRSTMGDKLVFRELLLREQRMLIVACNHSDYDYSQFIQKFELNDLGERRQLFRLGMYYEAFQPYNKFMDLCGVLISIKGGRINLRYSTKTLDKVTSVSFLSNYMFALERFVADVTAMIKTADILAPRDKEMLDKFSAPEAVFDISDTVLDHWARQVQLMPDQLAVTYKETELTYRQLDEQSDTVAWFLRSNYDVKEGDVVAILMDRSHRLAVITLGILKTGSAYVAIDQTYPDERKKYVLIDSGCRVLITEQDYAPVVAGYWEGDILDVSRIPVAVSIQFPLFRLDPASGSFIIYTSGSTGVPKGMTQTHKCLLNVAMRQTYYGGFERGLRVLQYSSVSFDVYVAHELFFALLSGGSLHFIDEDQRKDLVSLGRFIATRDIEWLLLPVSALNAIVEVSDDLYKEGLRLKHLVSAGEQLNLSKTLIAFLKGHPTIRLHNFYGPAETHNSANYTIRDLENLGMEQPVGRPSVNTWIFILDSSGQRTPVGVPGELYISSAQMAKGYINLPELTSRKFIPNPYLAGELMYKTGDIGRFLSNGNIMYMGRVDDQVKIRGFRVEPGEIENRLLKHPAIRQCSVVAREVGGTKDLIAYIVGSPDISVTDLRTFLSKHLPDYMVPALYVQMEALPLNTNGKVDKKRLPGPEGLSLSTGGPQVAPRSETEIRLAAIWKDILDRREISVRDDFFECGGHSLKLTRLGSRIDKEFEAKIRLRELFTHTVLEQQAQLIEKAVRSSFEQIPVAPVQTGYPLSSAQRRLWILCQLEAGSVAYNMSWAYILSGDLNHEALTTSFDLLIKRHESLRTIFREDESGLVKQYILSPEESRFTISHTDIRREQKQDKIRSIIQTEFVAPFNLSWGPLLRAGLFQLEDNRWLLTYTMHHIVSDGWSMKVFINDLMSFYHACIKGRTPALPELRIQYKDYSVWQQQQLNTEVFGKHREYWLQQLEGELPVLDLPGDKQRPAIRSYNGAVVKGTLGKPTAVWLTNYGRQKGATLFMRLLALVNVLLYRYTGQSDIVVGAPVAGREHTDLDDQIGFYLNMLPLRMRFDGADTYDMMLQKAWELTLGAYEHQAYPIEDLAGKLQFQRDLSRNALFDLMLSVQEDDMTPQLSRIPGGLLVEEYDEEESPISKFDLVFSFVTVGEVIKYSIRYNSDIYSHRTAAQLASHLERLIDRVIAFPGNAIGTLDFLSDAEQCDLLGGTGDALPDHPIDKTVVGLFEEQVFRTPANVALVCGERQLTYSELNARANQLAGWLGQYHRLKPDDLVGIMLTRSEYQVISILAVLKAGAAYVPVGPEDADQRLQGMIEDMGAKIVLTSLQQETRLRRILPEKHIPVAVIDSPMMIEELAAGRYESNPARAAGAENLAYVIYTSGTTGAPKGVMIEHRSLMDYFYGVMHGTNMRECSSFGLVQPMNFDSTVTVLWASLLTGGQLHIFSEMDVMDPVKMSAVNLDCIKILPSHWRTLQGSGRFFGASKCLIFGGEQLTKEIVESVRCHTPECRLYHHYGPTETTVGKLMRSIDFSVPEPEISLGYPIGKAAIYILDAGGKLVPVGAVGEICIGGAGVARGYLNHPGLTAEKFVANPFKVSERIYKTGDLGRRLSDGSIAFLGRMDHQVKIRGYRIEPGEIEQTLLADKDIGSAVVTVINDQKGEKRLVVYFVSKRELNIEDLRQRLGQRLPSYMIPGYFVRLEVLPLASNGKADVRALPAPAAYALSRDAPYITPRNPTEKRLLNIWMEILNREEIGMKDNFFLSGGESLRAMQLILRINREFDVTYSLATFFEAPTIEKMAEEIENIYWAYTPVADPGEMKKISI